MSNWSTEKKKWAPRIKSNQAPNGDDLVVWNRVQEFLKTQNECMTTFKRSEKENTNWLS